MTGHPPGDPGPDQPVTPYFSDVGDFVTRYLSDLYRRQTDGRHRTWCPSWWRHDEAVTRLEAVWRAWEQLRLDPAFGISIWLRDHADPHMAVLLDPDGPFRRCGPDKGHAAEELPPLPLQAYPAGLFDQAR